MFNCPICFSQSKEFGDMQNCLASHRNEKTHGIDKQEIYREAVAKFGVKQVGKSIEEMGELIIELSRFQNADERHCIEKIKDEIADVRIMLDQLTMIFSTDNEIESQICKKLKKLKENYLS